MVCWFSLLFGESEDKFGNAARFEPRRWLDAAANGDVGAAASAADFLPFHYGPRSCLGERFALVEATVMLASLIRADIVFARDDSKPPPTLINALTLKTTGIHMLPLEQSWQ